jgi:ribosomal protein S6--L-glutamate ligase
MKKSKKIGILLFSSEDSNENIRAMRLSEEIEKKGFAPEIFYCELFSVFFKQNKLEIYYNNKKFNPQQFLCFLPRYSLTNGELHSKFSIVNFLIKLGVKAYNSPEPAFLAKNKRDSLVMLALNGLPVIPTGINYSQFFLDEHLRRNKNNKIVAKANSGSLGYSVSLLDSHISFISFMEFIGSQNVYPANILIQPFIESNSRDYRLFVVGNRVVASMKRQAKGVEFRSNISKGGVGEKIKPSKEMESMAIKATKILGLDYAGVDIMKEKNKPMIVEVNSNPSLEIERITGINVVERIINHAIKKTK